MDRKVSDELTRRLAGTGRHNPLYLPCDLTDISALKNAEVLSRQHLKHHLQPEEVARLLLFLAADDSAGITS